MKLFLISYHLLWKRNRHALLEKHNSQNNLRPLLKSVYGNFLSDPGNKHKANDHTPSIIEIIEIYIKRVLRICDSQPQKNVLMHFFFIRDIRRQKHSTQPAFIYKKHTV